MCCLEIARTSRADTSKPPSRASRSPRSICRTAIRSQAPKFTYKLEWFNRLVDHAARLLAQDAPAILAGDFNVVPTDFDIYATRSFKDNALLQPAPRAAYAQLIGMGWTDALRK